MSPKVVDREKRKKEIALAALAVFSDKGFEASIDEVAASAGIGKGTVYQYFTNKLDLIVGSLIAWVDVLELQLEQMVIDATDPEQQLKNYAKIGMELILQDDKTIKLYMQLIDFLLKHKELTAQMRVTSRLSQAPREYVTGLILNGVAQGIFRPEVARDAEKIAINFLAYLDGIGFHHIISDDYFDPQQQVEFHIENLLRSLRLRDQDSGGSDV